LFDALLLVSVLLTEDFNKMPYLVFDTVLPERLLLLEDCR
jgi:hypothetical protein